ncbi:molecular chaperone [Mixta tenebrionis]|uniref:Molecular chaperone n=1 Tax=Mixta tenebrionis TaxID=2562439 RepID=A0A506VCF5_9GAMM|nr:molecular chaperone [Mixta tenebrionis]TPW42673.1 molecular chaperone [Mixta tenebrionis]
MKLSHLSKIRCLLIKTSKSSLLVSLIFLFSAFQAQASLVLDQSRIVISAQDGMGTVKINNPTARDYLIQNWITNSKNGTQEEIFVQPPLLKIKARHKVAINVEAIDPALAKKAQEQLYWLNVKEIPKVDKSQNGSQLVLAMLTRVKVFYRPDGVPAEMGKEYMKLKWKRAGNNLTVTNPTPYYITFNEVWEGNNKAKPLVADMVAPGATLTIKNYRGSSVIHYNIIDDYGDNSDTVDITL